MHPPITDHPDDLRARALRAHPSNGLHDVPLGDDGSLVTEYGLVAVVGATVAALAIAWASNGNIFDLFSAVLDKVKVLVGA
jgi:hypothetical protein